MANRAVDRAPEAAVVGAEVHESRVEGNLCFGKRSPIALQPFLHGEQRFRAGHVRNPPMPRVKQMAGRQITALDVVHEHFRHVRARHVLVDQHDVGTLAHQAAQRAVVGAIGREDQAVEVTRIEPVQIERLALELVARDAERETIATFGGGFLDCIRELGEERIGDLRHCQADGLAASETQAPGQTVLAVVERHDGIVDALGRFRRQHEATVQVTRNGRLRHICQFGDIANRGYFCH